MLEVTDAVVSVWGRGRVGMHLAPRGDSHDMGNSNPAATFGYVAKELGQRRIAFLCVRESLGENRLDPTQPRSAGFAGRRCNDLSKFAALSEPWKVARTVASGIAARHIQCMPEKKLRKWMEKTRHVLRLDKLPHWPRKIIVGVLGGIVFIAGIVMIVTPGPALIFIPLGLLLLASEFKFAEKWAQKMFDLFSRARERWRKKRATK